MPLAELFAQPNRLLTAVASLPPNKAVFVATIGIALVFLELNRPGRVLPGTAGLLLVMLAAAALGHHALNPVALLLLAGASATLAANLWKELPFWLLLIGTAALVAGLRLLVVSRGEPGINLPTALTCGVAVGLLATALSRVAFRARRLKAVH